MFLVVRKFSNRELADLLAQRQDEVKSMVRGAAGVTDFHLVRTDSGTVSVTICENREALAATTQAAVDWIRQNAGHLNVSPPEVIEGEVLFSLNG
jgi:hypothetical protein